MRPLLLRLHRWTTLVFSVPLAVLIVTGLILSVEPILQDMASRSGGLSAAKITQLLDEHDREGKARSISVRAYEDRLVLGGVGADGSLELQLSTGKVVDDDGRFLLSDLFGQSRRLHEHFLSDYAPVVASSTIAFVVLMLIGVAMGWPRLRHSVSGWHQGMAWFGLPLLILSPLTGLAIAFGITITAAPSGGRGEAVPIRAAVEMLSKERDLSGLIWLRPRGGRLLARLNEGGAFNVYAISKAGVSKAPTNWPRALHEGNFAGLWSGLMVLVTSIAFVGLMVTGLTIYVRRLLRPRNRRREAAAGAAAAT